VTCCLDRVVVQRQNHGVDIVEKLKRDDDQSAPKTLGDILYKDGARAWVEESAWVGLVRLIANEDQDALRSLYERTHRIVFTLAMRITNNQENAEEVTLDVFHDVWRRASEYDPAGGSVVGWIMNQARSRSIDRLRFETRKKRTADHSQGPAEAPSSDPQQTYQLEEQNRLLRKALDVLNDDERKAIETAYFSELSYQEVAVKLTQPPGTIKTRIRSGLAKLRQSLSETLKDL
jgi:RNA polymerase sigma-70 factor, ECF subfamily